MISVYCDRCGKDCTPRGDHVCLKLPVNIGGIITDGPSQDLCRNCAEEILTFINSKEKKDYEID